MTRTHCYSLLNSLVDDFMVGRSIEEIITGLAYNGFNKEDLLEFNFNENDINDYYPFGIKEE